MEIVEFLQTTLAYLLITIAGIFVIVNPLTTAFVFMSLTTSMDEKQRIDTALKSTKVVLFYLASQWQITD